MNEGLGKRVRRPVHPHTLWKDKGTSLRALTDQLWEEINSVLTLAKPERGHRRQPFSFLLRMYAPSWPGSLANIPDLLPAPVYSLGSSSLPEEVEASLSWLL